MRTEAADESETARCLAPDDDLATARAAAALARAVVSATAAATAGTRRCAAVGPTLPSCSLLVGNAPRE